MLPEDVCDAIAAAVVADFRAHPLQPLHVTVGCFESQHRHILELCAAVAFGRLFCEPP